MKRFFVRLGIYTLIMVVCDLAVGFAGGKLIENAKGGNTKRHFCIANKADEDVMVFGSSRVFHHYDTSILEDTLGLTAFNCGFDASGIICAYGFFQMATERHFPKILVYEITPYYDMKGNDDFYDLKNLRWFYGRTGVDSIFMNVNKTECYKMFSRMYRFNSCLPEMLMDNIRPLHEFDNGYLPLEGEMQGDPKPTEDQESYVCDSLKLYYLERLIRDCKGKAQLVFTVSPLYKNTDDSVLKPIKTLCERYDIPLLNHFTDSAFNYRKDYFYDKEHLNIKGATEYSKVVSGEIKQLVRERKCK